MSDLREALDGDEASIYTLNTAVMCDVLLGQTRNDIEELDDMSGYDTSEFPERKRLKEENPEGSNTVETRVQYKRERSKYKCGKCGEEKKHHICPVDQVRAGRRWAKQHAWTQTPTEFMEEGGSERAEPEEESGIVASAWNDATLCRDQNIVHPTDIMWSLWYIQYISGKCATAAHENEDS
jgi:hypothetical protein